MSRMMAEIPEHITVCLVMLSLEVISVLRLGGKSRTQQGTVIAIYEEEILMATSRIQPPMDHERDAKALTQRLLQNIGEGERKYVSEPLDIFAADVEAAVERFDVQLQFSFRSQAGFPFVRIVELVPMDWGGFLH